MLGLLQSFTAVLDEFGVSNGRAKRAARCAVEGLIWACVLLELCPCLKKTTVQILDCTVAAFKTFDLSDFVILLTFQTFSHKPMLL